MSAPDSRTVVPGHDVTYHEARSVPGATFQYGCLKDGEFHPLPRTEDDVHFGRYRFEFIAAAGCDIPRQVVTLYTAGGER